jgi:nucleotide-binding universal stress UspA family protein
MFRSILVALDGTPFGEHALPLAANVARKSGAILNLVHVHVPSVDLAGPTTYEETTYLDEAARKVNAHVPEVRVTTALVGGAGADSVAAALAVHAEKTGGDLIVLNSHARGGLSRWWMGNVADELVHRTALPMLVTPDFEDDPGWNLEPMPRHILIGLDGSPLAEQVVPAALALGGCMGSEYSLLRVVEPAPVPVVDPACAPAAIYDAGLVERQQAAAEAYLTRIAARLRGDDARLKVGTRVVLDADPAEAICGYLRLHTRQPGIEPLVGVERPIDLVALATHGRGGLARLLLGSVSDRVLQHTPIPLLLQRPAPSLQGTH